MVYSSSTPTSSLETHVLYVSLAYMCTIAIRGIIPDTGDWRACRAGFKANLSQIYSQTQEIKYEPTFLNIKSSGGEKKSLRQQDWN